MFEKLLNYVRAGCTHEAASWPIARVGSHFIDPGRGRQVCTDCGMYRYYRIDGQRSEWMRALATRKVVCQ